MRTLKFALATAIAAFALNANAQVPRVGMSINDGIAAHQAPVGAYQPSIGVPNSVAADGLVFHAGGVAACDGCHVMHNASGGTAKSTNNGAGEPAWSNRGNSYLLQGSDQSSTCLICHGSTTSNTLQFSVATLNPVAGVAPFFYSPAGDFGWLYKNYTNSPAQRHGHNIAARDFAIPVDGQLTTAPGGTWAPVTGDPLGQLACSSCHDPHGRYRLQAVGTSTQWAGPFAGSIPTLPIAASGSYGAVPVAGTYAVGAYRLLAGQRYAPASNPSFPFANDPPVAVAPTSYNKVESPTTETRVAYGTGMSEWCQNCHVNIHLDGYSSGWSGLRHPAGSEAYLHAGQYNVYNTYVSSGIVNSALTSNYTSLVPFEQGATVPLATLLANTASNAAIPAGATSSVMCLSCHRAHASAFDSMLRWDQNATFLTNGTHVTDGITAGSRTQTETIAGYYGRDVGNGLGAYQRSLCNKCHGKD